MQTIAFFGLGAMGKPMADNLLKAGYQVRTCLHRKPASSVKDLAQYPGFSLCADKKEAVRGAQAVITMLPGDSQILDFLVYDTDFADSISEGTVIIEMSSCTTQAVQQVEEFYQSRGVVVVDAPVSGGTKGAENGTLTIFSSGDPNACDAVRPLFEAMGKTIYRLGACGEGKTFKNLNNMLLNVNLLACCEVFRIAKSMNLDLEKLCGVISSSSGASAAMKGRWKKMITNDFEGGFRIALARKDLDNALKLADKIPVPLAKMTRELMLAGMEMDNLDLAAMCRLFDT